MRHGSVDITYRALVAATNVLARELVELGAGPDMPIGICSERSVEHVIATLGALRAGAAFLPLDPAWPLERMCRALDDAAVSLVIADPAFAEKLAAPQRTVLSSRQDARRIVTARDFAVPTSDNLAYLIYTSGSTGEPKGVEITQGNLAHLIAWHCEAFGITSRDDTSWIAGLAFDASIWELFPALAAGATIHIPGEHPRTSADALRDWLIDEAISIAFAPTPLAEAMITIDWPAETRLRTLLTGGDTLHVRPKPGLPFELVNNYGPTECTVVATSGVVEPLAGALGLPTIGRPIAGTRIEIRDGAGRQLPRGEIGEIYIAGANLGRGYRHRPELGATKFVTLADANGRPQRFYRTGDLGRWTEAGEIAFHGRCDDQLKLRGHRIEPDEISAVLSQHPSVALSAVVADSAAGDKRLVAYVVPAAQEMPRADDLRAFLARSLPHYMLPAVFVSVRSLPMTTNGKLDRAALPAPTATNTLSGACYRAPSSAAERRIAAIVEELLGVSGVGVDDNFFLLGGHSLLGTQLVLRVRDAFGADLTLRDLFEAQTIENLAAKIEETVVDMVVSMSDEELEQRLVH